MVRIFLKNFYSLVIIHLCPSYRDPFYILIVRKSKRTKVMLLHHSRPSLASLLFFRVFPPTLSALTDRRISQDYPAFCPYRTIVLHSRAIRVSR